MQATETETLAECIKVKLLFENWREFLTEAMNTATDLPDDVYVAIIEQGIDAGFYYADKDGERLKSGPVTGFVFIQDYEEDCNDAWVIKKTEATKGWGPLLYDLAMEYATEKGAGLAPDRFVVSPDALRVWEFYLSNRKADIKSHQLDDLNNTLTNPETDNCEQSSAKKHAGDKWSGSPLSKRYTKDKPDMMTQLKKMGKLIVK